MTNPLDSHPDISSDRLELSVVVPCYYTGSTVRRLYTRLQSIIQTAGIRTEIILIDDGSPDDTWKEISELSNIAPEVRGIRLSRNFGQQSALLAGLEASTGDRIFLLDDDLQDPPELLPEMMRLMDEGADVVYGQRLRRPGESKVRKLLTFLFYKLIAFLSDTSLPSEAADFRLMTRRVVDILIRMREQPIYLRGMVSWIGFQQTALHYERDPRAAGISHYHWSRLYKLAVEGVTSMSVRPLKLGILAGASTGILALLLLTYILIGLLYGHPTQGWTSLIAVMLILGAAQLFFIGIIGEYLACIFIRTQRRPLYLVRETTKNSAA